MAACAHHHRPKERIIRIQALIATLRPVNRPLATIVLAAVAVQLAFVAVGEGAASDAYLEIDAAPGAIGAPTSSVDPGPAITATPSAHSARADGGDESASIPSVQTIEVWELYIHPFWPDDCFWACFEIMCPCTRIIITIP